MTSSSQFDDDNGFDRTVDGRAPSAAPRVGSTLREMDRIDFLLAEIPEWLEQGWICDHCSGVLSEEYVRRRDILLEHVVASEPALAEMLPVHATVAQGGSSTAVRSVDEGEPAGPPLAEFLEAHSMKLLALLAALLIFAGMRQIVGWKWAGGLMFALVPILPISLTGIFYYFGIRSRADRDLGGYAYCVVAIVLAAFTVFSVNEHWLRSALSPAYALFVSLTAATALTGWTLRLSGDRAYLHLLFGGIAATVNAAVQIAYPSSWISPSPILAYGSAHLALALGVLLVAHRLYPATTERTARDEVAAPLLLWMHLIAAAGIARALIAFTDTRGDTLEMAILLTLLAALSALYTQWFGRAAYAYAAAATGAASAIALLAGLDRIEWYAGGLSAMVLCGCALAMSRWNARPGEDADALARSTAYEYIAWAMSAVAGTFLLGRAITDLVHRGLLPATADWQIGAVVALLCSAVYASIAFRLRRSAILYASAAAAAFGISILADRALGSAGLASSATLAQDLIPFAIVALTAETWLRRSPERATAAGMDRAAFVLSVSGAVSVAVALVVAIVQALVDGPSGLFWVTLAFYAAICGVGSVTRREESERLVCNSWVQLLMADSAVLAGFAAARLAPPEIWSPALAAGLALVLVAWAWFGLSQTLAGGRARLAEYAQIGAGVMAAVGGALATTGAENAAGWMTVAYAGALGLLVAMGARHDNPVPVFGSLVIVLLCPARLSHAALAAHGEGTAAVLATVLFALAAAAIYGVATWRMKKPDLVWLAAASLAIAGGGGILFGAPQPVLSRAIALTAGFGMAAGALGLGVTAGWGRRRFLTYAAGIMELIAYARIITIFFAIEQPWLGMAMLPALVVLVAASHLRATSLGEVLHQPLQHVALGASYIILPLLAGASILAGPVAYYPLVVTLFSYALVFGISAQAGAVLDNPLGILSTGALLGGWFFGLQVPRSDPGVGTADLLLVVVTAVCALLYARVAWRLEKQPPAYGAAIAGACAWVGLVGRLLRAPELLWSVSALPLLVGLCAAAEILRNKRSDALSTPLRRVALAAGMLAIAWAVFSGFEHWIPRSGVAVTTTLSLYGLAFAAAAVRYREATWTAAAALTLTLAYGYALAATDPTPAVWASRFAPAGFAWLAAALVLQRRGVAQTVVRPLYTQATLTGVAAVVAAAFTIASPEHAWSALTAFAVAGVIEIGLVLAKQTIVHAHVAVGCLLPAYYLFLRHVVRLDEAFTDVYLLPAAVYALVLANLALRRNGELLAWMLRWGALIAIFVPAFKGFYNSFTHGGTPFHAFLLLLECTAAIACGIAGRVKPLVQAGTIAALAFVAVATFAAVEIWTGLFAVVLGIGILIGVFYLSVHREAVRTWLSSGPHGKGTH